MSRTYEPLRWAIIGTGGIARSFVKDLTRLPEHRVVAVGSRTPESAQAFATALGIPHAWGSYAEAMADPEVDAVYVATSHPLHCTNTLAALDAGKHVLVEKPFAMNAAEASAMVAKAREKGLYLQEAMWTRFLPHMARVREILAAGTLGAVVSVYADHGQYFAENRSHRLYAPELGGGALLDLGIYPVSFAFMVKGRPAQVQAVGSPAFTGVDAQTSIIMTWDDGAHGLLHTTLLARSPTTATIVGTEAHIEFTHTFYAPAGFSVIHRDGRVLETWDQAYEGHGLREEAAEMGRNLGAGLRESPLLPLDESVAIMATLDEVRRQTGL